MAFFLSWAVERRLYHIFPSLCGTRPRSLPPVPPPVRWERRFENSRQTSFGGIISGAGSPAKILGKLSAALNATITAAHGSHQTRFTLISRFISTSLWSPDTPQRRIDNAPPYHWDNGHLARCRKQGTLFSQRKNPLLHHSYSTNHVRPSRAAPPFTPLRHMAGAKR